MFALNRRHLFALALSFHGAAYAAPDAATGRALVFGLISPRASEQVKENWRPFVDRMAIVLRQPIEMEVFSEQTGLVDAFKKGRIDLAWAGNAPAIDIVESGTGSVFAQFVSRTGGFGYKSVLVVPQASPLRTLQDVLSASKNLRFSDGDAKSTSGHLVPYYFAFQKNGVKDIEAHFKSVQSASHQKNLAMVAEGKVDVATANTEELGLFATEFPEQAKRVRVVWESPLIPQSPLLWRAGLPAEIRKKVLSFTLNFGGNDPEQKKILEQINNLSGFRQSNNRQLVAVADIEMFRARQAINNDPSLSADERARRIDEAIRRGSRLDLMLKLTASGR